MNCVQKYEAMNAWCFAKYHVNFGRYNPLRFHHFEKNFYAFPSDVFWIAKERCPFFSPAFLHLWMQISYLQIASHKRMFIRFHICAFFEDFVLSQAIIVRFSLGQHATHFLYTHYQRRVKWTHSSMFPTCTMCCRTPGTNEQIAFLLIIPPYRLLDRTSS